MRKLQLIGHRFDIWKGMRSRCRDPKHTVYKYYGGKGIRVSEEWEAFPPFRSWALSHGYQDSLTIDRLDPNGHYEPANCEWVTSSENSRRMVEYHRAKRRAQAA